MKTLAALLVVSVLALGGFVSNAAAQTGAVWGVYGGDTANTRYSTLNQVNTSNVGRLKVAWALQLGSLRSQESTPILVGDVLYVTSSHGPKNALVRATRAVGSTSSTRRSASALLCPYTLNGQGRSLSR